MAKRVRGRLDKVRTTFRLPRALYQEVRGLMEQQAILAPTFNDFLISAVEAYLKMLKRKRIDAAFAGMADDSDYQKEARSVAEQFAHSDWEALQIAERER